MEKKYFTKNEKYIDELEYPYNRETRYINIGVGDEKRKPELYNDRENCCGCCACYAVCPSSAISMEMDEEGFEYPVVDLSLCIKCYKCEKVCPIKRRN